LSTAQNILSVREIRTSDIDLITDYWLNADAAFLTGMGVELSKMPSREEWTNMLREQILLPYTEKKSYCIIWEIDNIPVGHSNINKIKFGEEAYMHLHLWRTAERKKGTGTAFVKMTIPYFFKNFDLNYLYCEPYALNPAPNKTLEKIGFEFVRECVTTPGWLNFEQNVKLWRLGKEDFLRKLN
jgi:RimJ/RimL family protein N-acetyltransferase